MTGLGACSRSRPWRYIVSRISYAVSRPMRSIRASGPIGNPQPSRIAASMSSRDAYRVSYIDTAWLRYPKRSALAMNPALSPTTTGCFPSRRTRSTTSETTPSSVTTVRITSTNDRTGAGLKKCSPTTRRGFAVATAISVTGSEDVFVARTASGPTTRSSAAKISFFRSRCSGTASTTRPQPATASSDVAYRTRECSCAASSGVSFPRATARAVECSSDSRPCATAASSSSTATTSRPVRATTSTMPAPIVPSPITPTLAKVRAVVSSMSARVTARATGG